jgi:hypothetical protein
LKSRLDFMGERVVAVASYVADGPSELSLVVGEEITVVHHHPNGWWVGRKEVRSFV